MRVWFSIDQLGKLFFWMKYWEAQLHGRSSTSYLVRRWEVKNLWLSFWLSNLQVYIILNLLVGIRIGFLNLVDATCNLVILIKQLISSLTMMFLFMQYWWLDELIYMLLGFFNLAFTFSFWNVNWFESLMGNHIHI